MDGYVGEAILTYFTEGIGNASLEEINTLRGAKEAVSDLETQVRDLKCYLGAADAKADHNKAILNWFKDTVNVIYEAEDVLELFAYKRLIVHRDHVLGGMTSIVQGLINRHQVGWKIKSLETKLSHLLTKAKDLDINPSKNFRYTPSQRPMEYPLMTDQDVGLVGIEESMEIILRKLAGEEEDLHRVVAIYGMGGLGKTTLARQIFNHTKVKSAFECFAWVCMGQKCPQPVDLMRKILKQLRTTANIYGMQLNELIEELHTITGAKKCLLVIDDLWEIEAWESLKRSFPPTPTRMSDASKIMITTRNKNLANQVDSFAYLHQPKLLSEEECWELLKKKTFRPGDAIDDRKEELGREMVQHCGGLPLAIIVLGGLLCTKGDQSEWEDVRFNIESLIEKKGILAVLEWSYYDLPPHLKQCFLYLAKYREDYDIRKNVLVRLWESEGFLIKDDISSEQSYLDIAEEYLNELVARCMIQVGRKKTNGMVKSVGLHDLMRDLCIAKAKERDEVSIICGKCEDLHLHYAQTWRMAIYYLDSDNWDKFDNFSEFQKGGRLKDTSWKRNKREVKTRHLRSLMVKGPRNGMQFFETSSLFKRCRLLRALTIEDVEPSIHKGIGDLVLLRYLSMRGSKMIEIPACLGNLIFLETLDLRVDGMEVVGVGVPNVLWRLERLRHLFLPCSSHDYYIITGDSSSGRKPGEEKLQLDTLRRIETLVNFCCTNCDLRDLRRLTKIRWLTIKEIVKKDVKLVSAIIKGLSSSLRYLSLKTYTLNWPDNVLSECRVLHNLSVESWGYVRNEFLPSRMLSNSLYKLKLEDVRLEEDSMPLLGKLPCLRKLTLSRGVYGGASQRMVCPSNSFFNLKSLTIEWLDGLKEFKVEQGAMPDLQSLDLSSLQSDFYRGSLSIVELPSALKRVVKIRAGRNTTVKWCSGPT